MTGFMEKKRSVGRPPKREGVRSNRMVVRLGDVAYRRLSLEAGVRKCSPTELAAELLSAAIDEAWPECEDEARRMFESIFD